MQVHEVRTYRSEEPLPREQQLAWRIAEVAADPVAVEPAVTEPRTTALLLRVIGP